MEGSNGNKFVFSWLHQRNNSHGNLQRYPSNATPAQKIPTSPKSYFTYLPTLMVDFYGINIGIWMLVLIEQILHHLGCSKCWLVIPHYQNLVWGMPSGAGIFPYQLCGYSVDICFGSATTWTKSGAR